MRRVACDSGRRHPAARSTLSIHLRKSSLSAEFASTQEEDFLLARTHHVSLPPENSHLQWSIPLSFGQLLHASLCASTTRGKPSLAPMPRRNTADVQVSHCQQLVLTTTICHTRTPRTPELHLPSSAPLALSSRHARSTVVGPPLAHCLCFPVHLPQLQCRNSATYSVRPTQFPPSYRDITAIRHLTRCPVSPAHAPPSSTPRCSACPPPIRSTLGLLGAACPASVFMMTPPRASRSRALKPESTTRLFPDGSGGPGVPTPPSCARNVTHDLLVALSPRCHLNQ